MPASIRVIKGLRALRVCAYACVHLSAAMLWCYAMRWCNAAAAMLLLQCCCCNAAAAMLLLQCCCCCCSSSDFFKYEPEAAVEATPAVFDRYLVTQWRQLLAAADAFRAQHRDSLGDKSIIPPANYHLPRRWKNPCAAIIFLPETISRP